MGRYLWFNSGRAMHVFLGREHKGVENNVFRGFPKQRRAWMQINGRALDEGLVTLLGILPGSVPEEARAERLADFCRVAATRDDTVVVALHDLDELLADVLRTTHLTRLNKVLVAPGGTVLGVFPAVVHVEQRQVVAVRVVEFGFLLVGLLLLVLGPVEDGLHGKHRDDSEHLVGASQVHGGDQNLGERRFHGEVGHLPPESCQ